MLVPNPSAIFDNLVLDPAITASRIKITITAIDQCTNCGLSEIVVWRVVPGYVEAGKYRTSGVLFPAFACVFFVVVDFATLSLLLEQTFGNY